MDSPALASAKEILVQNGLSLADLPKDSASPMWKEFKEALGFSTPQLLALKIAVASSSFSGSSGAAKETTEDFSLSPASELQGCLDGISDVSVEQSLFGPGPCLYSQLPPTSSNQSDLVEMINVHRRWIDQSAPAAAAKVDRELLLAIRLYTANAPVKIYDCLNSVLNKPGRSGLDNIRPFMKILIRALQAMDEAGFGTTAQCYRGVKVAGNTALLAKYHNYESVFAQETLITFAGFTSVTTISTASEEFGDSIFFHMLSARGVDISSVSVFPAEAELLVMPPAVFRVSGTCLLHGVLTVQLTQVNQEQASYLTKQKLLKLATVSRVGPGANDWFEVAVSTLDVNKSDGVSLVSTTQHLRTFWKEWYISVMAFSPDNSLVAVGAHSVVRVFRVVPEVGFVEAFKRKRVNAGREGSIRSFCFDNEGRMMAVATCSGITVISLAENDNLQEIEATKPVLVDLTLSEDRMCNRAGLYFRAQGTQILYATNDKVAIWDRRENREVAALAFTQSLMTMAVNQAAGCNVLATTRHGHVKIWTVGSTASGSNIFPETPRHAIQDDSISIISSLDISGCETRMCGCDCYGQLFVWNIVAGALLWKVERGGSCSFFHASFAPDGSTCVFESCTMNIILLTVNTGSVKELQLMTSDGPASSTLVAKFLL